ncbi:MAG: threonine/serine ThrE exporter family protein [Thermoanaerobaculia bacterium]
MGTPAFDEAVAFIERLGRALHLAGAPAQRLEAALVEVAAHLGIDGQFFATPTALFASLRRGATGRTVLLRVEPGEIYLERLEQVEAVYVDLLRGRSDLARAAEKLAEVLARRPRYRRPLIVVSFALASAMAAQLFGGGVTDMAAAGLLGLVVGLLAIVLGERGEAARLFEPVAGLVVAGLAASAPLAGLTLSTYIVTLSALIVLIPGLTLTVAMTELASKHLVAGSARFAGAMLTFITIAFGVGLGFKLGALVAGPAPAVVAPSPLPAWSQWLALALTAAALTVLFRARPSHYPWILAAAVLGMGSARFGSQLFGPEMGAFLGAVTVGVASNLYGRLSGRPAAIIQMPGLLLLVPGSIGFRSLSSLLNRDVVSGVESAFTMVLVAISIVTGLLIANVLVRPRAALPRR